MNKNKINKLEILVLRVIGISAILGCFICIAVIINNSNTEKQLEVARINEYKITTDSKAYIMLDEKVIDIDSSLDFVPLAISKERVIKDSIIGVFKDKKYNENLEKLNEIDLKISEKLSEVENIYSTDVVIIENKIENIIKNKKNIKSTIEMIEYNNELNKLLYEKALTVSKLSPNGSNITNLINERDLFYNAMNNSMVNSVKTPLSGVIVYEKDGLENKYNVGNLKKDINKIEEMMKEYSKDTNNSFGVKIVNNYESYLIVKDTKENDKHAKEGLYYDIELIDLNVTLRAKLENKIATEALNYYIFKVTNGIEKYIDLRTINVSVVFKKIEAFPVSNEAIYYKDGIAYIKIFSLNEYIEIPVKSILTLNDISYVENYSKNEKEQLKLEQKRNLLMYDRIVIN